MEGRREFVCFRIFGIYFVVYGVFLNCFYRVVLDVCFFKFSKVGSFVFWVWVVVGVIRRCLFGSDSVFFLVVFWG